MKHKKGIRQKLTELILFITVLGLVLSACCSIIIMMNMRSKSLEMATSDAITQVTELANSRATLADSMLTLAQNQTLLVADGARNILENSEKYLRGYNEDSLVRLTCDGESDLVIALVPEEHLLDVEKSDSTVTYAKIDGEKVMESGMTLNQQLYLGSLLKNEFTQIYRFKTEGTEDEYKGFAASYFCFDDSGIDILGDPKLASMIAYDGRTRGWYKGAVEAYQNGTLTSSGVYWTEPVADGAGRGMSMVCSAPVVVDGKIVGVAGSGGLINDFADLVKSSTIGNTGYSFMVSRNSTKVIINPNSTGKTENDSEIFTGTDLSVSENASIVQLGEKISAGGAGQIDTITIDGHECFVAYSALENNDWTMVTIIDRSDDLIMNSYRSLNNQIGTAFIVFFVLVAILIMVAAFISSKYSKTFTKPIISLKEGVDDIGAGHWDRVLEIKTGDEIEDLGNSYNAMAKNLDEYVKTLTTVTAEKERIGAELDVAAHIQSSMLPCIFPAFPERRELDIYATMNPAKEVGGDFYDFFMIDKSHIAIVMADVSGKGVPAALFMVIGKTLIKDHTQAGKDLGEVFSTVNNLLCEANSEGLFITAFEGVLDLETGEFTFVNAGHEMPFIAESGKDFAPYQIKPGFVLAGMEDMRYRSGQITLSPGDKIFQYTDGVTEATNADNKLYGMERLQNILLTCKDKKPEEILPIIKADIDKFVGEAPQFDDITMLCLEYKERMIKE